MAIKLVIDSSCDANPKELEDFVILKPLKIYFDQEEYLDNVTITNEEFYKKMSESKTLPRTSQVNSYSFEETFKQIIDDGDEVLGIFISSALSGTYNSAVIASESLPKDKIELVDSKLVTFAYLALVDQAIKLIKQGLSLKEIKEELEILREKVVLLAAIGDLTYLQKGGRLSATAKVLANIIGLKPTITMEEGKVVVYSKCRGLKKAYLNICDDMNNKFDIDYSKPFYVGDSDARDKSDLLIEYLHQNVKENEIKRANLGPTVGVHAGPGCAGVAFFTK